jgi:hypothetical protein
MAEMASLTGRYRQPLEFGAPRELPARAGSTGQLNRNVGRRSVAGVTGWVSDLDRIAF